MLRGAEPGERSAAQWRGIEPELYPAKHAPKRRPLLCGRGSSPRRHRYLAAFSFFFAFFSFTVSLGLLVVFDFSWPLGIVKSSLRKPKLARLC